MGKKRILKYIKLVSNDIQKIKLFIDDYFVYDDCNCDKCSRKRNEIKLKELFKDVITIDILKLRKEHIFGSSVDLYTSISSIYKNLKAINKGQIDLEMEGGTFCTICGSFYEGKTGMEPICDRCRQNYYDTCSMCGIFTIKKKDNRLTLGKHFCESCKKKLVPCHDCGRLFMENDLKPKIGFTDCRGEYVDEVVLMCGSCINNYSTCEGCGEEIQNTRISYHNDHKYCSKCIVKYVRFFDYSYKPAARFSVNPEKTRSTDKNLLYFGAEIEVECSHGFSGSRNNVIRKISDEFGSELLYGKHDGSLSHGFEYVTHPFSWDWFLKNKYRFNKLFSMSRLHELHATRSCGVHIHMSKKAFTSYQLYKFMHFINHDENRVFVNRVCGRDITDNEYCSAVNNEHTIIKVAKDKERYMARRNSAVNLMAINTVEVRIFASTIWANVFYSYLEFLHSLYNFTNKNNCKKCTVPNFRDYLNKNKNQNLNLIRRLSK